MKRSQILAIIITVLMAICVATMGRDYFKGLNIFALMFAYIVFLIIIGVTLFLDINKMKKSGTVEVFSSIVTPVITLLLVSLFFFLIVIINSFSVLHNLELVSYDIVVLDGTNQNNHITGSNAFTNGDTLTMDITILNNSAAPIEISDVNFKYYNHDTGQTRYEITQNTFLVEAQPGKIIKLNGLNFNYDPAFENICVRLEKHILINRKDIEKIDSLASINMKLSTNMNPNYSLVINGAQRDNKDLLLSLTFTNNTTTDLIYELNTDEVHSTESKTIKAGQSLTIPQFRLDQIYGHKTYSFKLRSEYEVPIIL